MNGSLHVKCGESFNSLSIDPTNLSTTLGQAGIQNNNIGWANFSFSEGDEISGLQVLPGGTCLSCLSNSDVCGKVIDLSELSFSDNVNIDLLEDENNGVNKKRENSNPSMAIKESLEVFYLKYGDKSGLMSIISETANENKFPLLLKFFRRAMGIIIDHY